MSRLGTFLLSLIAMTNAYAIDYCAYFPDSIQTNNRTLDGLPFVSKVDFAGHDQELFFDTDGFQMPFNYLFNSSAPNGTAAHCYYPNDAKDSCGINPSSPSSTLPVTLPPFPNALEQWQCGKGQCTLPKNSKIQSLTVRQGKTLTLEGGEVWIGSLTLEHAAKIKISSPTVLHYRSLYVSGHSHINKGGDIEDLILIGHGAQSGVNFTNHNQVSAALYVDPASFHSGLTVSGEHNHLHMNITVNHLLVTGKSNKFTLPKLCGDAPPPSQNYYLELEPVKGIALSCETQRLTFTVVDKDGVPVSDYTKGVRIAAPSSVTMTLVEGVHIGGDLYNPSTNGLIVFDASSQSIEQINISGELVESANDTYVTGDYEFTANKFAFTPDNSGLIAGKPATVEVRPVTCSVTRAGRAQVVAAQDYSGIQEVAIATTSYHEPKYPSVESAIQVKAHESSGDRFESIPVTKLLLDFSQGSATPEAGQSALMDVRYDEVGRVSFELSQTRCLDEDKQIQSKRQSQSEKQSSNTKQCVTYKGVHELKVRPWTFAICDASNYQLALDGTSEQGSGYKAAGERFDLDVLPIRWQQGGAVQGPVSVTQSWCNDQLVTKNYFDQGSPVSSVTLSAAENTPAARPVEERLPLKMNGEEGSTFVRGNQQSNQVLPFYDLYWEDVGSLLTRIESSSQYLDMTINPSVRNIGRFYPHHLALVANDWGYESGHDNFAYMDQLIRPTFVVEARNLDEGPTPNYGHFAPEFIVTLSHVATDSDIRSYLPRISATALSWEGTEWQCDQCESPLAQLDTDFGDYVFARRYQIGGTSSIKELPVKTSFGLESNLVDGVDFESPGMSLPDSTRLGKAFPNQPDFRYGRMVLGNIGGDLTRALTVPLQVEYWSDSGFVLNHQDSGSVYNGKHFCQQTVWSGNSSSNARLFNMGAEDAPVDDGEGTQLFAVNDQTREQVNLWLRLDSSPPAKLQQTDSAITCHSESVSRPWLRYDWRGVGDEDPHTVVTFGSFRGNDRVIYRGEPRLIGQ